MFKLSLLHYSWDIPMESQNLGLKLHIEITQFNQPKTLACYSSNQSKPNSYGFSALSILKEVTLNESYQIDADRVKNTLQRHTKKCVFMTMKLTYNEVNKNRASDNLQPFNNKRY